MAKTPKLLILSFLMLITLSISVQALTVTDSGNLFTCSGTYYYGSLLSDGNHLVRFASHNISIVDDNCNIIDSVVRTPPSLSIISNGFQVGSNYWVGSGSTTDYYTIFDSNLDYVEDITLPFDVDRAYGTTDGDYVYIASTNRGIDRYSLNGIWLNQINIGSNIGTEIYMVEYLDNGIFLISDGLNRFYEMTTDFQSVLSNTSRSPLSISKYDTFQIFSFVDENDFKIINTVALQTQTNNVKIYNVTDGSTLNYYLIDDTNYSKQLCIDSDTYCSDTSYNIDILGNVVFVCESINNILSCSDTCINVETDSLVTGQCTQLGCTNECNIIGGTTCTSGSTYATCGQFDSDACLEFGSVLNCPTNQYCSDEEVGSQCSTLTTNTLYNQDFLSVDLDLQSQSGVIKEEGTSEKTKNIAEIGLGYVMALYPPSYLLGFDNVKTYVLESFYKDQINETYVMSSFEGTGASTNYYAYNCDYEQNYFLSDNLEHNDLNNNGWEGSGVINTTEQFNFIETTGTINKTIQEKTNSETDVIIELLETGTYNVKYYNDENLLLDFEIVNNKTNFNILVTEKQNNKVILNSTSTSDDLQEIFIRTSFINDVEAGNNFISLIRNVLGQDINENYFSLPLGVGNSLNPNKIVFESNTNQLWIYEVIGSSIKDYPVYTNDEESIKNFECQHTQAECYIVRAYGNTQGMSTYYFYEEIQTCIQSLNGVVSVTTPDIVTTDDRSTVEKALNKNWNTKQKLLFAVITLIIVFGLFGALTMADGDKTFMLIGTILTGVLMFYFIIDGFIPAWVIVLFGIVGAFISASAIRNMSTGA